MTPYDDFGHGTHCAGIIAGNGAASNGKYRGIAPEVSLIGVKVLGKDGSGNESDILAGIEYAADTNAQVISMSLGSDEHSQAICDAVSNAVKKGKIVICAAGNSGPKGGTIGCPSDNKDAITVGAIDPANYLCSFSSRGPMKDGSIKPDVVAPGFRIVSCRASGIMENKAIGKYYLAESGTSMACPMVSGTAALLVQKDPELTPQRPRKYCRRLRMRLGTTTPNCEYGYGRVSIRDALKYMDGNLTAPTPAPGKSPVPSPQPSPLPGNPVQPWPGITPTPTPYRSTRDTRTPHARITRDTSSRSSRAITSPTPSLRATCTPAIWQLKKGALAPAFLSVTRNSKMWLFSTLTILLHPASPGMPATFRDSGKVAHRSLCKYAGCKKIFNIKRNNNLNKNITNDMEGIRMEQELMRIGVSLPDNLLGRFDQIIEKRGYSSRSEGIRDAIRNYILHYEWMNEVEGARIGIITLIYDHDQRGLVNSLTDIQHESMDMIKSSVHVHLDHDNCLEIIMLQGDGQKVKMVAEKMMALKGVKHVKLTTISPNTEL